MRHLKSAFAWIHRKRLTPLAIFFFLLFSLMAFIFFTEGTVVLPAIYRMIP